MTVALNPFNTFQFAYVIRFGDDWHTELHTKSNGDKIELGMVCGIGNRNKQEDPKTGLKYENHSLWYFKGEISNIDHIFSDLSDPTLKTSDGSI